MSKNFKKLQIRPSRLATGILKAVGVAGLVATLVAFPGLGIVAQEIHKISNDQKRRKLAQSLYYLRRRGYVMIEYLEDDRVKITLTKEGKTVVQKINIQQLTIPNPQKWDKKWRFVIFDVPNWKSKNRSAFTDNLKRIGFVMVQKSVWAYPFPCHDEIMILRKYYDIEKHVVYLETAMVEDEHFLRDRYRHFDLSRDS